VVGERSVVLWGVEVPWEQISDVYLERDAGNGFVPGMSRDRLIFRLARPELLSQQTDRVPRHLAKAVERGGLVGVPLPLANVPTIVAVEVIERCRGRSVAHWDDSPEERRLRAAARGESPPP
jgi:hypothetical protein